MKGKDFSSYFDRIISGFVKQRFPDEIEEDIQRWLIDDEHAQLKEQAMLKYWENTNVRNDKGTYRSLIEVKNKLGLRKRKIKLSKSKFLLKIAAVITPIILITTTYLYLKPDRDTDTSKIQLVADANTGMVLLPDSSQVWISQGELLYPEIFKGVERVVELKGNAYFKITANPEMPFIVKAQNLNVKVLGTEFNISSEDENDIVSLVTGRVEVETANNQKFELEPNQQLILNTNSDQVTIKQATLSSTDFNVYTGKDLIFENIGIRAIIDEIQKEKNVTININPELINNEKYNIKFLNNESIEEIIQVIEVLIGASGYTIIDNNITIN